VWFETGENIRMIHGMCTEQRVVHGDGRRMLPSTPSNVCTESTGGSPKSDLPVLAFPRECDVTRVLAAPQGDHHSEL
jgi:hypothetical protein